MKNLTLIIGGRDYVVACAAGEEAHVTRLGQIIDGALASSPPGVGQSETRSLLFAALLLADEVHAARATEATARTDAETAAETAVDRAAALADAEDTAHRRARMLAMIAGRLENIAAHLESAPIDA